MTAQSNDHQVNWKLQVIVSNDVKNQWPVLRPVMQDMFKIVMGILKSIDYLGHIASLPLLVLQNLNVSLEILLSLL